MNKRGVLEDRVSVSDIVGGLTSDSIDRSVLVHVTCLLEETLLVGSVRGEGLGIPNSITRVFNVVIVVSIKQESTS